MRTRLSLAFLACAVFLGACGEPKPEGPFVPLVGRLAADSQLVLVADLAAASKLWSSKLDEVGSLPVVANNPGLKQLLDEQLGLLRSAGRMVHGKLGFDPFQDLTRAAVGISLDAADEPSVVAVVEGKFPADLFKKALAGVAPRKVGQVEVYKPQEGDEVALVGQGLIVATHRASMDQALAEPKLAKALLDRHPDLFAKTGPDFILRLSLVMPEKARQELSALKGQPAVGTLADLKRLHMDLGDGLRLGIETLSDKAAEDVHYLLQAEGQMISGSHHTLRGIALMALALDLDQLPEAPPQITQALADRKSLQATVDQLLPPEAPAPVIERKGKLVTLSADKSALKGALVFVGAMSAAAIPAFLRYRAAATGAAMDKAY